MKIPYKLKSEILIEMDKASKGTAVNVKMIFVCDPEKNVECNKRGCGKCCTMTKHIEYAKHFEIDE